MAMNTQPQYRDTSTGKLNDQKGLGGSSFVADTGVPGQSHNRYIELAGSTATTDVETMTWTEAEAVYAVRFRVVPGTTATVGVVGDVIKVVFDASPVDDSSDVTQANAWLTTATVSETTDVEYFELDCGGLHATLGWVSPWSEWFQFDSPLRRADFLAKSADKHYHIFAEVA